MTRRNREIRLARRPQGRPRVEDFTLAETELAEPGPGEVLVRNLVVSVDPGQRGLMDGGESYVASYRLGQALTGRSVGRVIASNAAALPEGTLVFHRLGWRELAVLPAAAARPLPPAADPADHLDILGHPGLTAWLGVGEVLGIGGGEVVLVSSAAGAVGGAAGQLARLRGAKRVIGTTGSEAKTAHLRDTLGFDVALNHRAPDFAAQLAAAAPEGIDAFFDNVGGVQLETALPLMRLHGRIAICGALATYNDPAPPPLRGFDSVLARRLRIEGFLVYDHEDRMAEFLAEMQPLLAEGRIRAPRTLHEGLDAVPAALIALFQGGTLGKALVRLDEDG